MREFRALVTLPLLLSFSQHHADAWSTLSPSAGLLSSHQSRFVSQFATPPVGRAPGAASTAATARRKIAHARQVLTCKLDRLPTRTLKRVVPLRPTTEKYLAFFGQTPNDRKRKMINLIGGLFAFYWAAFFATRNVYVLGPGGINAVAWRGSCLAVFYQTFLGPMMVSYNRALELWGAGNKEARRKTKGALFTGRVARTGFAPSSQESTHRSHFQMLVKDESGRELLFDVPQAPEYRRVRKGMRVAVVVLSRSSGFYELTGVTEAYLPELDLFVGRFPLLDKRVFYDVLRETSERNRREEKAGVAPPHRIADRVRVERRLEGSVTRSRSRDHTVVGRDSDVDGYEVGVNDGYRTGTYYDDQRQDGVRAREVVTGGRGDGRYEGGMVARSSRSIYS